MGTSVAHTRYAREMLLQGQADSVSDKRLLSMLVGESAVGTIYDIIESEGAQGLWSLSGPVLLERPGVGPHTAARLLACVEVSKRMQRARTEDRPIVRTPEDVVGVCGSRLRGCDRERFLALALNTKNRLIRVLDISTGSLNASIVHPRELFKDAVRASSASIVVVHNHPSGDPTPSGADISLTRRLVKAGDVLGIEVLDHVVIGDGGEYVSMRDVGLL